MRSSAGARSTLTRHQRDRIILEALEPRQLLSYTWITEVADTGNATTNGTELKNVLNGTTKHGGIPLQLGDTIVLAAGATYYSSVAYTLVGVTGGSGTITIESSDIYSGLGHLPSGTRVSPALASYMPKITSSSATNIIKTAQSPDTVGWTPAGNYSFVGVEVAPSDGTKSFAQLVVIGDGSTHQDTSAEVPTNFIFDRCYVHGYDDYGALANTTPNVVYKSGIGLNCLNATVENSYISDIHNTGADCNAIGGVNGLGNYTITNNFLEATGENVFFGGADSHLGVGVDINNVTITKNFLFKRLVWDPFDPSYYGVHQSVKNLFELKHATNVLFDQNLLENCWVGADQKGEGIAIGPKNQSGGNTWTLIHDVTITNNVILNVAHGIQITSSGASDLGYTTLPMYNVLVRNNLIESVNAGVGNGNGGGFEVGGGVSGVGTNLTIDHNTVFNSGTGLGLGSSVPWYLSWTNFTFTNNVVDYGQSGISGSPGAGSVSLNTFESGIIMSNGGTGYTAAPTVTFSGGGGSGATGTALISGGSVYNIEITNNGSGYTSAPTIIFGAVSGASGAAATATITSGQVKAWTVTNNVFFGNGTQTITTQYPSGNFVNSTTATQDQIGLIDPAGQITGFLATSSFHNAGTDSKDPGVDDTSSTGLGGIPDFSPIDSTLKGYWKFDEGSGTSVSDSSGNGKTGTLSSSSLWTSSGQSQNALALTGGASGSVSVSSFSTTSPFTFTAWINPTAVSTTQYIASTANNAFSLQINSSGKLVASGTTGTITDSTALTAGQWYMVAVTFNGSTMTLYRTTTTAGGVTSVTSVGSVAATTTTGSTTLYLGGNGGSVSSFNGAIDEARYYNTNQSNTDLNGRTGLQQLYMNYGPLINVINPQGGSNITTTTSVFSTTAADHAIGHANVNASPAPFVFTWSEVSGPAGGVTFDPTTNGTNAGQSCTATWSASGAYVIQLVVTDGHGGSTTALHTLNVVGIGTVPAAPTNIAATPGTSNIVVTWTDNASNETAFDVQRSSDGGLTWADLGNVASSTGTGGVVTYTDTTAASDGTAYLYQVAATNAMGDSTFNATTCAMAEVIAYEGFNYTSGGTFIGSNGGLGFSAAWTGNTTYDLIASGSLTYTNSGHALTTSGNEATITHSTTATRTLTNSVGGTDGTILWASYELNSTGGTAKMQVGSSTNNFTFGWNGNTRIEATLSANGSNSLEIYPTVTGASGTLYFLVVEVQYFNTGDVVDIWVNPQPGGSSPSNFTAHATRTFSNTQLLTATNSISILTSNNQAVVGTFDEIRLGASYASVAPDPVVNATPAFAPRGNALSATIPAALPGHALLQSILVAAPAPIAAVDLAPASPDVSYTLYQDAGDNFDSGAAADLTFDAAQDLLLTL